MTAPSWVEAAVREFASAAGIGEITLNERGAAVFRFENGIALRFECTERELVVATTVPSASSPSQARRLLEYSHPEAHRGVAIRAGYLARSGCAIFAVSLEMHDVTLPMLNKVFDALWRVAMEFGGVQ